VIVKGLLLKNDIVALKLLLDMYEDYSKTYDIDLYKEIVNTMLLFYYSLNDIDVDIIYNCLRERSIIKIDRGRVLLRTKREYVRYYRKEKINFERMNNCTMKLL
jgi:hypothetical protein